MSNCKRAHEIVYKRRIHNVTFLILNWKIESAKELITNESFSIKFSGRIQDSLFCSFVQFVFSFLKYFLTKFHQTGAGIVLSRKNFRKILSFKIG